MRQIYSNALVDLIADIRHISSNISSSIDADSLKHWQNQLVQALHTKSYIQDRLIYSRNTVYVDFLSKKRVA